MTTIPLSGADWCIHREYGAGEISEIEEWLAAKVPGDVHTTLLEAGLIPDPFFGLNSEEGRWIEEFDWWYKKEFALEPPAGKRAHLVFEGVDYIADIFLNRHPLGRHEGMFARQVYEVTPCVERTNTLAVRLQAARDLPKLRLGLLDRLRRKLAGLFFGAELFPDRLATLKCQMSYGWDFAPRLLTSGIWDDAFLHLSDTVYIRDVFVRSRLDAGGAAIGVKAELDSLREIDCEVALAIEGANFVSAPLISQREFSLPAGDSTLDLSLQLSSPRLWQPWDRGEPNLYRLKLEVRRKGALLDSHETTFGVRSVEMAPNQGAPDGSADLTLIVNGQREFIRGANWVPADSLFARVTTADYGHLISLAKEAGVNMLRVWGGGLREKKAFYDICDAKGILVWQEFPLACAFFDHYPSDERFVRLVREEVSGILRHLRNHASLAVWCGGNEFAPSRNRKVVDTIRCAVDGLDGSRPFLPASPGKGDGHNWRVWHGKASVKDYRKDKSLIASEFGLQAAPGVSTLQSFLTEDAVYPPGRQWEYHCAQLEKLSRYAAPFEPESLDSFVEATQSAQAIGLQVAIEHFRRRKGYTSGTLFWQLNEPWPSISWSVIDYFRRPKQAYLKLKEVYNPVLISLCYPLKRYRPGEVFAAEVWAVNDLLQHFEDCDLRLSLGEAVVHQQRLSLPPDSSRLIGEVEFVLGEVGKLRLELTDGQEVLSHNSYELGYFDPAEVSRRDALRHWLAWRALDG